MSHKTIAATVVWLVAAVAGSLLALSTGPAIEGTLAPVLANNQIISNVERQTDRVCWDWSFVKLREATPDASGWFLVLDGKISRVPVTVVYRDHQVMPYPPRQRPVGPGKASLCALLPPEVELPPSAQIQGRIIYATDHDLWRLTHDIKPFAIPPLTATPKTGMLPR